MPFRYRKRLNVSPPGLRWLVSAWINFTERQARGAAPSLSVQFFRVLTWNSRQRRWRLDLPGGAAWEQSSRAGGVPRFASPRFVVTVLGLFGVSVVAVVGAVIGVAWQWIQGVMP